jgi:NTE family protein
MVRQKPTAAKPAKTARATKKTKAVKTINLALQGGGAHGAFTWGVLDALLEDGRLNFEGVSATSAGAMNAAVMAHGMHVGGAEKARELLESFWREISLSGQMFGGGAAASPFLKFWGNDAASLGSFEMFSSMFSPYQFNPLNINPLREVLEKIINVRHINECRSMRLFITATDIRTGLPEIFENEDVTIDALLASAGLPLLFQAVEIKGHAYWDGGYMGNPSLWPLFYRARSADILLVHVNPVRRDQIPRDPASIENRLNEITFNAALLKELRAIDFVKKLLSQDMLKDEYKDRYKDILFHAVRADDVMQDLSATSKYNTDWAFLKTLRDKGRHKAQDWLSAHFDDVGRRASVDIRKDYLTA